MQPLPHQYNVTVSAHETGPAEIQSPGLNSLTSAPPREFGGPGNLWSPETLIVGAIADCFVLTFRAVAAVTRTPWAKLVCEARGTVDRIEGTTRFTAVQLFARLMLPAAGDADKAQRLLEKAEKACLVGNSLKCRVELETTVTFQEPAFAPTA
jgi:peroxiredoxin-like protein